MRKTLVVGVCMTNQDLILKIYNTMSREIEEFKPLNYPHVHLYACGPTVYDYAHIGHIRKYTFDDVLIRLLRYMDYDVRHVQNITDVGHLTSDSDTGEDKLEKGARKYQESVYDIARKFEQYFYQTMDMVGNVRPEISCRATENIPEQIEMVRVLMEKGFAYEIENDGIYFDTSKVDDYGKLARLDIDELKEGARVEKVEGKRNLADFALWKYERPGENRAMAWESPWSERGFPGWHIECSTMSIKYLGEQFDIHTGGIDHIPVHHTNEIAQAEAYTDKKPFVKYWVHHNFLRVDGEKMSKSLDNFLTIDDVIEHGYEARALRLLFLMSHYRHEQNFTWQSLDGAQKSYNRLVTTIRQIQQPTSGDDIESLLTDSREAWNFRNRFLQLMTDDLSTPGAVSVIWEVIKSDLTDKLKYHLLLEFDEVLGLGLAQFDSEKSRKTIIPQDIKAMAQKRQQARSNEDWSQADKLRNKIEESGFQIMDMPGNKFIVKPAD